VLSTITENDTGNVGVTISTLVGAGGVRTGIADVDNTPAGVQGTEAIGQGVAIYSLTTAVGQGGGTWEFKLAGASTWTAINAGAVNTANALLLGATDSIRFVPDAANATTGTIGFYLWDGAAGTTAGSYSNATTRGTTTPYSIGSDQATITVTAVNDAPTIVVNNATVYYRASDDAVEVFGNTGNGVTLGDVDIGDRVTKAVVTMSPVAVVGGVAKGPVDNTSLDAVTNLPIINETLSTTASGATINGIVITGNGTGAGNLTNATQLTLTGAATLAQYREALATIKYNNVNTTPTQGDRPILVQIWDDGSPSWDAVDTPSNEATVTVNLNWAPIVYVNGEWTNPANRTRTVGYAEGDGPIGVTASNAEIRDQDGNITSVTVTLTNRLDGTAEKIYVANTAALTAAGITGTANSDNTQIVLTVTAGGSLDGTLFQLALRAISYENTSQSPNTTQRVITVASVDAGGNNGLVGTTYINVSGRNDAPVLTANGADFTTITEEAIDNDGQLVSSILGTVSDVDSIDNPAQDHLATNGKLLGVAVHALSSGEVGGTWQYKLALADAWVTITPITAGSALLLQSTNYLRFVPDQVGGTTANSLTVDKPSISFYAWDQAVGTAGTELVIASNSGQDNSTLSTVSDTVEISITDVNDAPVITAPATLTVLEDATLSITGVSIADVDVSGRNDSDDTNNNLTVTLSVSNGTITLAGTTGLTFNSSTTNGSASLNITGSLSAINTAIATLTYTPTGNYAGADSLVIGVNDGGNVGGTALTDTETIAITVTGVNDAPVLTDGTPVLSTITEDDVGNAGTTISTLVGAGGDSTGITDADNIPAGVQGTEAIGRGVAIYALGYNTNGGPGSGGVWQYKLASGGDWVTITTLPTTTTALLLGSADALRFNPDAKNGGTGTVDFYLWDGATGTAGASTDVTTRGTTTAFSSTGDRATIAVSNVNDNGVVTVEDLSGTVTESGTPVTAILQDTGTINFTDVDWNGVYSLASGTATPVGTPLGSLALVLTSNTTSGATGQVTWTYSVADTAVEYLKVGQTKVEQFTVNILDNQGATITRTVAVTITGTNDAPVLASTTTVGAVTELVAPTGTLTTGSTIGFTDVDVTDTHTVTTANALAALNQPGGLAALGTVTANVTTPTSSGTGGVVTWDYSVNASSVEYLAKDEIKRELFDIVLDDNNSGTGMATRRVEVIITGTNDAPTNITTTSPLTINEVVGATSFLGANTTVASLSTSDVDLSDTHAYTIVGGADAAFFRIVGNELQLRELTPLDAEVKRTFVVNVRSEDKQGATLLGGTFTKTFTVTVNDINEFSVVARNWLVVPQTFDLGGPAPIAFAANTLPEYNYTGTGTGGSGTFIGVTASAVDEDATNNTVTYALMADIAGTTAYVGRTGTTPNTDMEFRIDAGTGALYAIGNLDFETEGGLRTLYVKATSADGSSVMSSITLNIANVDEVAPTFANGSPVTLTAVAENSGGGQLVYTAQATDTDFNAPSTATSLTYTLDLVGDHGDFDINATTGALSLKVDRNPNYEVKPSYTVTVRARDNGGNSTTQVLNLSVTDVDEFDVTAAVDSNAATNTVAENSAVNTLVGVTASAVDADGTNNTVTYSLVNVDGTAYTANKFQIDGASGVVRTGAVALNYETDGATQTIYVKAASADGSTSQQSFTVELTNVNEDPTGTPYIAGTALQGSTLTIERNDLADEDGINTNTFSYKWYAGGVQIANENSAAITLKQAQVGKSITASISYSNLTGAVVDTVLTVFTNTTNPTVAVGPVADLNDAPLAVASNVAATEDGALILPASSFGFSDAVDAGGLGTIDALLNVRIESLPATGTGVLTLNGSAVTVGQVVATSALVNTNAGLVFTPATNVNGPVSFTFSVQDNGGIENAGRDWSVSAATMTLNIAAVNDAPVLTVTAPAMVVITEDAAAPVGAVGTLVSALVNGVSDVDASALRGVAISATNATNGTYHYSLNNGENWTAFPAVSNAASLLLAADSNTRVYFQPTANFNGTVSNALSFRAWDQTSGTAGQTVNTTVNGGTTAFSATSDTVSLTVNAVNDVPTLVTALTNQPATEDVAFSYVVPANAFADVDSGDTLTYSATLFNGGALPSWLAFNPITRTFSGTPANGDVGTVAVRVTATDTGNLTATSTFNLAVANVNDAPTLANPLLDKTVAQGATLNYQFASNSFADIDAVDTLTYTATKVNGDALPSWLLFNAETRTFSGTPANGDVGTLDVKVTARDGLLEVSDTFSVTVTNVNDAPTLLTPLFDKVVTQSTPFSWNIVGKFADIDVGDVLSYTATLANGNPLPSWLNFDASQLRFSGTPDAASTATIQVKVTARDTSGAETSDVFGLGQIAKQANFAQVAATTTTTGRVAIYGVEVKDLAGVNLGFTMTGTVTPGVLTDYLELVEDDANNKATVYLKSGVTLQSLINALGGLGSSFNVNTINGADTVTDVVTIGGAGSDIQTTLNLSAPVVTSPTTVDLVDGSVVYQVTATDSNGAGVLQYSLSGADAVFFTIDSSGAVRVKDNLTDLQAADYLSRSAYNLDVVVKDGVLGLEKTTTQAITLERPEVDKVGAMTVVATQDNHTTNNANAVVDVTNTTVAPNQLAAGMDLPYGKSLITATQEVDQGLVPTNISLYVDKNAGVNGFWTTINGSLVNLATAEFGGSMTEVGSQMRIDLKIDDAFDLAHSSNFVDNGVVTLNGAAAKIDLGALGANPLQANDLFWS
jgi:VCBS repeat-containing protein